MFSVLVMHFGHCIWALMTMESFKTLPLYKRSLVFGARLFQTCRRGVGALE